MLPAISLNSTSLSASILTRVSSRYAETLLASSRTFVEKTERSKGIRFSPSFDEPHYFVIVHRYTDKVSVPVTDALEKFNRDNYKSRKLETSNLIYNENYALTFVGNFPNKTDALE